VLLATGFAAALPVMASTFRGLRDGWVPTGDDGIIASRAIDVLTAHTPLLGQYSVTSELIGAEVRSLGPLLYWVLAVPARIGPEAMTLAMGALNVATVIAIVWVAERRGGRPLMFAAAAVVALLANSVPPEVHSDVWNPSAAVLPFTLLILLSWSLACGDGRLLPLTALVASFVVQCHLTYLLPSAGMLVVGAAGLLVRNPDRRALRRPALVAAAVALVCWSAPLIEQATHRPGNFIRVVEAATTDEPGLGTHAGRNAVIHTVGLPPWWVQRWNGNVDRFVDVGTYPGLPATVTAVLLIAALGVVTLLGLRRRRRALWSAGAIALVLCASVAVVATATPETGTLFYSIGYTLWWASAAGAWAWGTAAVGLVALFPPRRLPVRLPALPEWAGVAVVALVGAAVAVGGRTDESAPLYEQVAPLTRELAAQGVADRRVRVDTRTAGTSIDLLRYEVQAGIVYDLRRRGATVAAPVLADALGPEYRADDPPYGALIDVSQGLAPNGRVIARIRRERGPEIDVVTVALEDR
jgi:hypothetical protein